MYNKNKKESMMISVGSVLTLLATVGIFWGAIADDRQRISTLEEAVGTIKGDTTIIKQDIKTLLTR